jgi:hypothetical protein
MNKKILIGIMALILVSAVIMGTVYNTKEEAITAIQTTKAEGAIEADSIDISVISDKLCTVNYDTEQVEGCHVCYNANYSDIQIEECVYLSNGTTLVADNNAIKSDAQNRIQDILNRRNQRDVQYKERVMAGNTLKYTAEQMPP